MARFKIKLANQVIGIDTKHIRSYGLCRRFFTDDEEDFQITITQEDLVRARGKHKALYGENTDPWDGFLEFSILFEKVSERIIDYGAFAFHGAVIGLNGEAYLFTAPSGTGKTTHILKWINNCPKAIVINGDKPFIKISESKQPYVCGTPWSGKENLYTNIMMPLKAIIIMERSEKNYMEKVSYIDSFPVLLQQVYRPYNEDRMRKTLKMMRQLEPTVEFWRFHFNNYKEDCFSTAYNSLISGEHPADFD